MLRTVYFSNPLSSMFVTRLVEVSPEVVGPSFFIKLVTQFLEKICKIPRIKSAAFKIKTRDLRLRELMIEQQG
jgi:hypothetical protein